MRVLLSVVCLWMFATPARAECAWVFWAQGHNPNPGAWVLQTAYPNVNAYTKALDQREKDGRKATYVTEDGRKLKGATDRRAERRSVPVVRPRRQ